ncbi:DUF3822 family protein [Thermophagus sp. OGC60D27]|uniref:DUF3822 family protein n=1 Tax=Thermophagus sp. OGC60D27 TaxID=3458415 RepID=UPI004037A1BD
MVPDLSFVDETFDANISSSYFLSIQVCLDGFSFSTLDPVRNKYIQFRHYAFKNSVKKKELPQLTDQLFNESELLNLPFRRVFILIPTRYSTIVPSGLFKPEEASQWLHFTHQVPENYQVSYTQMKLSDGWNVFAIPSDLHSIFQRQFPGPIFFQQYVPMTETKLAISRPGASKTQLIINLQRDYFDVVVIENNNLKLCNSFLIKGENDLIYYTLFVFDQLQLSPIKTELQITGHHPDFNTIKKTLEKYIKHVKQPGLPSGFQYSYLFKEVPGHQFHNLLSMASCVS